jgi:hypothetical protein
MKISAPHVLLVLLLAAQVSEGQERRCRDVGFPEHLQAAGTDLSLNGLGMRKATFLKINVYVGALYVVQPSRDARALIGSDTPQELILHFVRNVAAEDLRKAFAEDFARIAAAGSPAIQERVARLNGWMSDMKSGQRLIFLRSRQGIEVRVDGAVRGTIEGEEFARLFIGIWLGPSPPNPELKNGLLGGECG